jgi:hypothetical protein
MDPADVVPIRLPRGPLGPLPSAWPPSATLSASIFSAHPVDQHKHLLAAHRVRQSNDLGTVAIPTDGRGPH